MNRSTLLTIQTNQKLSDTLLPSRRVTDRPGTTQRFGARLTVTAISSIAHSPSAELDTPSMNRAATIPSSQEPTIADSMQDVANELLHGGSIYSFIKLLKTLVSSLMSLSASKDVSMLVQRHIEERYSSVP